MIVIKLLIIMSLIIWISNKINNIGTALLVGGVLLILIDLSFTYFERSLLKNDF